MSSPPARHVNVEPKTTDELVAVIGLGAVMPDANNVPEFWNNIVAGRDSVREVPKDRWDQTLFWDPDPSKPDKTYAKIGAFITNYKFNSLQFKIPPNVGKQLDDTQKWALTAVAEAFHDAGYDKKPFDRTRCAVILGNAMGGELHYLTSFRIFFPEFNRRLDLAPSFSALPREVREAIRAEAHVGVATLAPDITEDTMPGELSNCIA